MEIAVAGYFKIRNVSPRFLTNGLITAGA